MTADQAYIIAFVIGLNLCIAMPLALYHYFLKRPVIVIGNPVYFEIVREIVAPLKKPNDFS